MINNATQWGRRKKQTKTQSCVLLPYVPIRLPSETFALHAVVLVVRHVLVERAKGKEIQMV